MMESNSDDFKEIRGDIKALLTNISALLAHVDNIKSWTLAHQENDSVAFGQINRRINHLYTYASAVAVIAFFVGRYLPF